jgi:hypothetical protein
MRTALSPSSVVTQNCTHAQPLMSCPRLPSSSVSTVNHAVCRLPSQVKEPRWLCHQAPSVLPNPKPSAVSRVALLDRDPDVIADVARVPRMNLCDVTTHVHWAEHGCVAKRERIVLSARRRCPDKPDRGNSGDRKETSQRFSLRGKFRGSRH